MFDLHARVISHLVPSIVQSPYEVDVFAVAQGIVEAVAETAASNEQARTRYEVDTRIGNDERAAFSHVQRTELLFESVAKRRTLSAANSRCDSAFERILEVRLQPGQHVKGVIDGDVDVDEPQ